MAEKSAATDTNSFLFEHARRQNSANLKGFLKLDVNMGFMGDSKMESPTTMLQPVVGWKKGAPYRMLVRARLQC